MFAQRSRRKKVFPQIPGLTQSCFCVTPHTVVPSALLGRSPEHSLGNATAQAGNQRTSNFTNLLYALKINFTSQIRLVQQYLLIVGEKALQLKWLIFYHLFPSNLAFLMSAQKKKRRMSLVPFNFSSIFNIGTTLLHFILTTGFIFEAYHMWKCGTMQQLSWKACIYCSKCLHSEGFNINHSY